MTASAALRALLAGALALGAFAGRAAPQDPPAAGPAELWAAAAEALAGGDARRAAELYREALERRPGDPACAYGLACARLALGEREEALEWLGRAVADGFVDAPLARWDPDLEALRGDARFEALLASCAATFDARAELALPRPAPWTAGPGAAERPELAPDGTRAVTRQGVLWDLERGAVQALLFTDPARPATFATFSPRGTFVATADRGRRVRLFDPRDATERLELEGKAHPGLPLSFSADERRLACASPTGLARVYALPHGELVAELATRGDAPALLSPQGERALTLGPARCVLWDVDTGRELWSLDPGRRTSFVGELDPDGRLAVLLERGTGELWVLELESGRVLSKIDAERAARCTTACFLPGEERVAVGRADGSLELYDARRGVALARVAAHAGPLRALRASRDGAQLGSRGDDRRAVLWDAVGLVALWEARPSVGIGPAVAPAFDQVARRVAIAGDDESFELRDPLTGAPLAELRYPVLRSVAVAFTPDGRSLGVLASDGSLRLVELESGATARVVEGLGPHAARLSIAPDGARFAASSYAGHVHLGALPDGAPVARLAAYDGVEGAPELAFSPDGARLATWGRGARAGLFDARTGALERWIEDRDFSVLRVEWSPGGARLAALDAGQRVRVLDAATGAAVGPPLDHREPVRCLAFHPAGDALLTAGDDGVARLHEIASGALRAEFVHPGAGFGPWIDSARFDPSGRWLATTAGDVGRLALWEVATGRELWRADYGGGAPLSLDVRFDAAGERLLVAGRLDRGAWIVSVESAVTRARLGAGIGAAALSPDERAVAGVGGGALHVFDAERGAALWTRYELDRGEHLRFAPSGHYDGSPAAARRAQVLAGGDALPLDGLAAALYDPKKVRAAAAGVPIAPAPSVRAPVLRLDGAAGRPAERGEDGAVRLTGRAFDPEGVLAIEARHAGARIARVEPELDPGQQARHFVFELRLTPPAGARQLELRALGRGGLASRPARIELR